jgi:hypothetical protein
MFPFAFDLWCWQVKCDETKPVCANCKKQGFDCPGFNQQLRWSNKHEQIRAPPRIETVVSPEGTYQNTDEGQTSILDYTIPKDPATDTLTFPVISHVEVNAFLAHLENSWPHSAPALGDLVAGSKNSWYDANTESENTRPIGNSNGLQLLPVPLSGLFLGVPLSPTHLPTVW